MKRLPSSHKGDNGKVCVVGGSRTIHGAPVLSALAAEASGVDLIYVCLPDWHENVAKEASLNFQVHPYVGDSLEPAHVEKILKLIATMDTVVIGPGIAREKENIDAVLSLAAEAACQLVLDAAALQPGTLDAVKGKGAVLTPHLGELERMDIDRNDLEEIASSFDVTIVLKEQTDLIVSPNGITEMEGGNPGLTVGGTGDILAGLIAGLIALGMKPDKAASKASQLIKTAGEELFLEKGYAYRAVDVLHTIPSLLAQ